MASVCWLTIRVTKRSLRIFQQKNMFHLDRHGRVFAELSSRHGSGILASPPSPPAPRGRKRFPSIPLSARPEKTDGPAASSLGLWEAWKEKVSRPKPFSKKKKKKSPPALTQNSSETAVRGPLACHHPTSQRLSHRIRCTGRHGKRRACGGVGKPLAGCTVTRSRRAPPETRAPSKENECARGRRTERADGIQDLGGEEARRGGEHPKQYAGDVMRNWAPDTCVIL